METPHRLLRATAEDVDRKLLDLSDRDLDRRDRILTVAQTLFAHYGRHGVTFRGMAAANHMAPVTLRRFFADIDELLGKLLWQHIKVVTEALGGVNNNDPDRHRLYRQAYLTATRAPFGGCTTAHMLFILYRHTLPDDMAITLEETRRDMARLIAGPGNNAIELLDLLDTPNLEREEIELIWERRTARAAQIAAANMAASKVPRIRPQRAATVPQAAETGLDDLSMISGVVSPGGLVMARAQPPP